MKKTTKKTPIKSRQKQGLFPRTCAREDYGLLRVAAVSPRLKVGDVSFNVAQIKEEIEKALFDQTPQVVLFPELCITGYTCKDLFHNAALKAAALEGLRNIVNTTDGLNTIVVVGLPLHVEGKLFNVAAVISNGKILGFVPKRSLVTYSEFEERRWFASGWDLVAKEVDLPGFGKIPIGIDLLFSAPGDSKVTLAVEICEDAWTPITPGSQLAVRGATILLNPSASTEIVGKRKYRRELVNHHSGQLIVGYVYASSGPEESTMDVVYGGHLMVSENGTMLAEHIRLDDPKKTSICADLDLQHIERDREHTQTFGECSRELTRTYRTVNVERFTRNYSDDILRPIAPSPFVPTDKSVRVEVTTHIMQLQTMALVKRLQHTGITRIVLGLSGGLDSTLALLVAIRAFDYLGIPRSNILAVTMPGLGTSKLTKSNADRLAKASGVSYQTISVVDSSKARLKEIGHNGVTPDVTYENVQARERTTILMDLANKTFALVLGTGDLSEAALGWCTFNGDHMSQFHINAGVPKTLVRYVVKAIADMIRRKEAEFAQVLDTVVDDTPVSPELTPVKAGKIDQKTEDILGPYELHDFFLYHFVRWGSGPKKIFEFATIAFDGIYDRLTIFRTLKTFLERFIGNQWKRSVMPDSVKVGSVCLSPRGDWRMPSDASNTLWMTEFSTIEV